MSLKYDNIVDRVVLKNRLVRWKILSLVFLFLAAVFVIVAFSGTRLDGWSWSTGSSFASGDIIGRITIDDFISADYARDDALAKIKTDKSIKALIVRINSPGGSAGASEALYRKLLSIGVHKPVVAVLGPVAASGGYMVALAGDHIVANATTLTGSVGVVLRFFNVSDLAKKVGVHSVEIKTSEYKAAPSMFYDMSEPVRKSLNDVIDSTYDYFAGVVAMRRNLSNDSISTVLNGRVYTGAQALDLGLIDALGGEDEAIQWLRERYSYITNPVVRDVKIGRSNSFATAFRDLAMAGLKAVSLGVVAVNNADVAMPDVLLMMQ